MLIQHVLKATNISKCFLEKFFISLSIFAWAALRECRKDRSDDPSHHERTLLPQSYIYLHFCLGCFKRMSEGSIQRPIAPWANTLTTELICCTYIINFSNERKKKLNKKYNKKGLFDVNSLSSSSFNGCLGCFTKMSEWKEGNVLFNDTLDTFYLRLYGIRHIVKNHSERERGNPLLPHGLLFPISSKGSFIYTILQTG